ncbi:MAG: tetratricopeptide repeat protein [Aquabacterium sp.]
MRHLPLPAALHRTVVYCLWSACLGLAPSLQATPAQPAAPATIGAPVIIDPKPAVNNSDMDAALFYQLMVAEMQLRQGQAGVGYQIYLEAAKRRGDGVLFRRAVDIALQARAGEQALDAAQAWRRANPQSLEATQFATQIMLAMGKHSDLADPLTALIRLTPADQQGSVLLGLPRNLQRLKDRQQAATLVDQVTQPWRQPPHEKADAWVASADAWAQARHPEKALAALQKALALEPAHIMAGLQAVELADQTPAAQALVSAQLARPDAPTLVRLAHARKLATKGQFETAERELTQLVQAQPDANGTRVLLAAVQLEQKRLDQAQATLQPLVQAIPAVNQPGQTDQTGQVAEALSPELEQAALMQAQIAEQKGQARQALNWLQRADPTGQKLSIQTQRARLMARQGQLGAARALIRGLPEDEPRDGIAKIQAEASLLRDARQWREAHRVLGEGLNRFPDVTELLYDQAMMADKIKDYEDMERLLKRLIELEPDNANAHNALGYSLADRGVRLNEARPLLEKAISLKPGDPFITDSLGWLAFREGQIDDARRLLQQAWDSRQDAEIGAHLGEVLWVQQERDRARAIWRESWQRDRDNTVLQDTLKRFGVSF